MLRELLASHESVSFIGMCKNAGQTTALNRMIEELHRAGEAAALTSVGRDGESSDLVTNTVKPGIYIYRGTLLATAAKLLKYCDITKEILYTTGIHTPLGEIVVLRALSDGFVQAAGPSLTSQMAEVEALFRKEQNGRILIDGALERKSISARKVSESCILCTGASYHKDMAKVVRDTAFTCRILTLPQAEVVWPGTDIKSKFLPVGGDGRIMIPETPVKPEEVWQNRNQAAGRGELQQADEIGQGIGRAAPEAFFVQGGLTDSMVRPLLTGNTDLRGRRLILKDGSRILLSPETFEKLEQKGLSFAVEESTRLLAVTVNPFSAYGFHFDGKRFLEEMRRAVPIPVLDVRGESYESDV